MSFKSHIEKTQFFSCKHRIYILMGFKFHIKKILCYPFKLKYLNQKDFYPTLKKKKIFFIETQSIYTNGFQIPHLKKKKHRVLARSRPGNGLTRWVDRVVALTGLLTNPDRSSPRVDQPGRSRFNNYGFQYAFFSKGCVQQICHNLFFIIFIYFLCFVKHVLF